MSDLILLKEHIPTCYAMLAVRQKTKTTPWFLTDEVIYCDEFGFVPTSISAIRFTLAICNSSACGARCLIKNNWLETLIHNEILSVIGYSEISNRKKLWKNK